LLALSSRLLLARLLSTLLPHWLARLLARRLSPLLSRLLLALLSGGLLVAGLATLLLSIRFLLLLGVSLSVCHSCPLAGAVGTRPTTSSYHGMSIKTRPCSGRHPTVLSVSGALLDVFRIPAE
jgi:hypothetical protein